MQYIKVNVANTVIEFHNNWMGEETVIVNGQTVSKKSSVWGTNHNFSIIEDGESANYVLTTRLNDMMQVVIDVSRNGVVVHENVVVRFGFRPSKPKNKTKQEGIKQLKEYDLDGALAKFEESLKIEPNDPEVYFHMACAYSVKERVEDGFEALKKSIEYGLQDTEMILNHDMLAFLRMHSAFESFLDSNFTEYEL